MVPPPNRLPLVSTVHWLESLEPKKNDWPVSDNTDPGVESTPVRTVVTDVLRVVDAWVSFADALNVGLRVIRLHSSKGDVRLRGAFEEAMRTHRWGGSERKVRVSEPP